MLNISFTATVRKCSNCGSSGHNRATCPLLPCSVCRDSGHKSSMCPTLREQRVESERSRHRLENMSIFDGYAIHHHSITESLSAATTEVERAGCLYY